MTDRELLISIRDQIDAQLGSGAVPDAPGTEHFSVEEFACNDGTPVPPEYYEDLQSLMEQLEVLREDLGGVSITVNSGYRSPEYNESIDGAKNSKHMLAQASDIEADGPSPKYVADTIEALIKQGKMLEGGLGRYSSFTHYDVRGKKARWGSNS